MRRIVAQTDAGGESRLAGIGMALLTLRCMEKWRAFAGDYNSAIVLLAVVAITAEKLTRAPLDDSFRRLEEPLPPEELTVCNISSIAAATGFNRETTRRYVNRLIERAMLERYPDGSVGFPPGYVQRGEIADILQSQLENLGRSVTDFLRLGALALQDEDR